MEQGKEHLCLEEETWVVSHVGGICVFGVRIHLEYDFLYLKKLTFSFIKGMQVRYV